MDKIKIKQRELLQQGIKTQEHLIQYARLKFSSKHSVRKAELKVAKLGYVREATIYVEPLEDVNYLHTAFSAGLS